MWKKSLALMAIVATVATLTTFSVPASAEGQAVSNLTATPSTFNPAEGETSVLRFNMLKAGTYDIFLYDSDDQQVEQFVNDLPGSVGQKTLTFYGTSGNNPSGAVLPDDTYTVIVVVDPYLGSIDSDEVDVTIDAEGPAISDLTADPTTFDATMSGASTTISFTTDEDAYITAVVTDGTDEIRTFSAYNGEDLIGAGDQSFDWDGKNDLGNVVSDGTYTVSVTAEDDSGNSATDEVNVTVDEDAGLPGDGIVSGLVIKPSTTWDPSDEPLEIEFELGQDVDNLLIKATNNTTGKEVEILDENNADADDYEEEWDGEDEDGDYVGAGAWTIKVIAEFEGDNYVESKTITIAYEVGSLDDYYVTKDPFDPEEDEFTYLVFKTDGDANVSVNVVEDDESDVVELWDEEEVNDGDWYAVKWDGKDEDDDVVDEGDYYFEVKIANLEDEDEYVTEYIGVTVEQYDDDNDDIHVYKDYAEPVIVQKGDDLTINYCLDADADEVTVEIYEGKSTGGNGDIVLVDEEEQDEDCYSETIEWTGKDDDEDSMDEGVFSYKITAKNGDTAKEEGYFVYGDEDEGGDDDDDDDGDDDDFEGDCTKYYYDLNNLKDEELCTAIAWATEQGIFSGYPDNSFKPYTNINRAETLKVLLEAFEAPLLPPNGSNLGFWDLDPYAWYMTYARTGQFNDMLDGYPDGAARLGNYINRVEMLKFALEAANSFTGANVYNLTYNYSDVERNSWYSKYLGASYTYGLYDSKYYGNSNYLMPGQLVQRGEMALMLYRMNNEGLLNGTVK